MEPFAIAALALGGYWVLRKNQRADRREAWTQVLAEAAERLGGRSSPGSAGDAPSLRATVDQITVTVTIQGHKKPDAEAVAIVEARMAEDFGDRRVYFGWATGPVRPELAHIPEIPFPHAFGLSGPVSVRSDDATLANDFVKHAVKDIADVRQEASASAIEILARGGSFRMAVHGLDRSAWLLERLVTATTRLVRGLEYFGGVRREAVALDGPSVPTRPAPPASSPVPDASTEGGIVRAEAPHSPARPTAKPMAREERCGLCQERPSGEARWVRCNRCGTPYHEICWIQATGCLESGCEETRATPL
jgi:hypothetical protein